MSKEHLLTILWLRWRLSANQFSRRGKWNNIMAGVLIAVGAVASLGGAGLGFTAGLLLGQSAAPLQLLALWDAILFMFLVFWGTGLLIQVQRSESIDLTRLLHLPIGLKQVFLINYLISLLTPSLVVMLPGMLGLSLGLGVRRGPSLLISGVLVLGFVFVLTAWTYYLRGWLAGLMVNKRRRQSIMVWLTLSFILIFQLPNLLLQTKPWRNSQPAPTSQSSASQSQRVVHRSPGSAHVPSMLLPAHIILPPAWVGYGTMRIVEGDYLPAACALAASSLLGAWGLGRAYRSTLRFYLGGGEAPRVASNHRPRARPRLLLETQIPSLSAETTALLLAFLRSTLRAPELKMALLIPIFLGVGMFSAVGAGTRANSEVLRLFAGSGAALLGVFSFASLQANMFGLDRGGFRTLVLLPVPRWRVLLAKNLAILPLGLITAMVLLGIIKVVMRPSWEAVIAALFQFGFAFCMFSLLCNSLAILFPYRIKPGTLQASKSSAAVFVVAIATTLVTPLVLIPMVLPSFVQHLLERFTLSFGLPINVLLSFMLMCFAIGIYWLLLPAQGRLLQQREQMILQQVTEEVE